VMPHACIGVDVIVGFPVKLMSISWNLSLFEWNGHLYLHVFKYSERDNTEAAEMLGVAWKCPGEKK
jgi:threonylcarbamoyladenosine tRNA methylthiotransferase MtaB